MGVCLYIYVPVFLFLSEFKYYLSVFVKKRKTERLEFCEIARERERERELQKAHEEGRQAELILLVSVSFLTFLIFLYYKLPSFIYLFVSFFVIIF